MKKVEAIIRKTKFEEVKKALNKAGIEFFTYWDVRGVGKDNEERTYRGINYDTSSIQRIMLSIYVRDHYLDRAVNSILESAQTGEIGDGKIFVSNIENAFRIRTSEEGGEALYIKEEEK